MVAEVEQSCAAYTIFASNTSSLPIGGIAAHATRPEQVISLHFFGPVEKTSLVGIIPHTGTSTQTVATTIKLAKKQGKTPIVVRNKAGFYVNRILVPHINEVTRMLTEGERVEHVDAALVESGFPVDLIQLLDEVGIDTGTKIIPVLEAAYGECFSAPVNVVSSILDDDRKGRKSSRGSYLYDQKRRKNKKQIDPTIYPFVGAQGQGRFSTPWATERRVMLMLNEAICCVDEQVIRSVHSGDIDAVFGISFPPLLDGPFRYVDSLGADEAVAVMQRLAAQYGSRFTPCERLVEMGTHGEGFWKTAATDLQ